MRKLLIAFGIISLCSCTQILQERIDGQHERESDIITIDLGSEADSKAVYDTLIGGAIVQRYGDKYLFQEDMVFSEATLYRLMPPERSYKNDEPAYYWPLRRVYYQIDSSIPDSTEIKYAMSLISASSSVVFLPKEAQTHNYIKFKLSSGNNSEVGMQAGGQTINLINYNHYGIVMHEIMHALGFSHEACRQDRDDHITINWSNIKLLKRHNFYIYDWFRTANVGPIDFYSIMMYSSYTNDTSFVNDTTQPMFLKLDGNPVYAQSSYLSPGDIEGLKSVYGPPFHRVESYHTVTTEEYYGNTEHIEMDGVAYVKLYSDENCTTRASSSYPRQLLIDINIETYSQGIQQGGQGTIYELTIPAGVDSVCLGSYHNVEYYFNSDPYNVSITRYRIVNSHVAPYTPPATYPD